MFGQEGSKKEENRTREERNRRKGEKGKERRRKRMSKKESKKEAKEKILKKEGEEMEDRRIKRGLSFHLQLELNCNHGTKNGPHLRKHVHIITAI